jgi:bile acid-coenzyme A ligase
MPEVSYSRRFTELAGAAGEAPMLTLVDTLGVDAQTLSWSTAESRSNQLARAFADHGAGPGDYVTMALPNGVAFVLACIAAWKVGAVPQPVSARLPAAELDAIVELADARIVLGVAPRRYPGRVSWLADDLPGPGYDDAPLPDCVAPAWKAPTSGGSTGRPKLIVSSDPSVYNPDDLGLVEVIGFVPGGTTLMPGPLYHNGPFIWVFSQLLLGGHVVVLRRFDAALTLDAIERHHANCVYLVPTMMSRIWKLPSAIKDGADLSSLTSVWHLAAPCPEWLKRAWLDWLGPARVWELYGGTEGQAVTVISGPDWLSHPGSVGRVAAGEIKIVDDAGVQLPAGEVGEVYMRPEDPARVTYFYKGASARQLGERWESLGDMGWLDDEGFLYLADRRSDMILSGGANIYPAEIEAAIDAHPSVKSSAVIGLPDEDLGQRIHAVVQADNLSAEVLAEHVSGRLARYKVPRSFEFVRDPLRDDAGKVRRSALIAERAGAIGSS